MPLLEAKAVTKKFGGVVAVDKATLTVEEGEIRGIIGPNGSGKTTLLNLISGIYRPDGGEIRLNGQRIDGLRPHEIAARGVARTFQIPRVFRNMTVLENMLVPAVSDALGERKEEAMERALKLLEFIGLDRLKDNPAKALSGGQMMLLQIARGLMLTPLKVYLMDEPFAGVNPVIKEEIVSLIRRMNSEERITFIIVSHEMPLIKGLCQKVTVMHAGQVIAEGSFEKVASDMKVIEAYLGG